MPRRGKPKPKESSLALLIHTQRQALGWSIRKLAAESGLGLSTVHNLLKGPVGRSPHFRTLKAISDALDIPLHSLQRAAQADVGLAEQQKTTDPLREAIYEATENFSQDQLNAVFQIVHVIRSAHQHAQRPPPPKAPATRPRRKRRPPPSD